MPDTGQPAPCTVAAALANHLGRLDYTISLLQQQNTKPRLNQQTSRDQAVSARLRALLASLPNAADEQTRQALGLRIVGYDRNEVAIWAEDNSTAAQGRIFTKRKLSSEETERLRIAVNRLTDDKDCSDFLRKLLRIASEIRPGALRYGDNIEYFIDSGIERLFSEIRDAQKGFFVNSGISYNTVHGDLGLGTIEILFSGSPDKIKSHIWSSGVKTSERELNAMNRIREENFWRYAPSTAIHEMLHAAGFGDVLLARAVAEDKGEDISHITNMKLGFDQNWEASKYWDKEYDKHCGAR